MQTDHEYMALSLANLSGLPVRLYREGRFAGLYHHTAFKPDLAILEEEAIFQNRANVSYHMTDSFLFYGLFRAPGDGVCLVIGPVPYAQIDSRAAGQILRSIGEPQSRRGELMNYLMALPAYPLRNFLQILCTINYFINGEKVDVSDFLICEDSVEIEEKLIPDPAQYGVIHNTQDLERQMLTYVEFGETDKIRELFRQPSAGRPGQMAQDGLRQEKNLFVCTMTLVSRAAMKGGLDNETAMALSDLYIQKAELLGSYTEIYRLLAHAVYDFTGRVAEVDLAERQSVALREAKRYLLDHIGETVPLAELAAVLGLNRTSLCRLFKECAGMTVNAYATDLKIKEARRLLRTTAKPLSEIAEYLGFSSQSYFQNVFKHSTGVTPGEYRGSQ